MRSKHVPRMAALGQKELYQFQSALQGMAWRLARLSSLGSSRLTLKPLSSESTRCPLSVKQRCSTASFRAAC